ncbi:hypothetical protein Hanom_Chr06g00528821 [Helianthus anomalus]
MECNRGKQVITSRGGSRSISNHLYHMFITLFSFMGHLCSYLDHSPLFVSSNFNVF